MPERDSKGKPDCTICNPDPSSDEGACKDHEQGTGAGEEVDPIEEAQPLTAEDFKGIIEGICDDLNCKVISASATRIADWKADMSLDVDNTLPGCDITAYQIQWFNGSWPGFYEPDKNDTDWKTNNGSEQLVWSYFYDHNHRHIYCPAQPVQSASDDSAGAVSLAESLNCARVRSLQNS